MNSRERQIWTEFVRKREECKSEKRASKRRAKKPGPTPAELEAALDDLTKEEPQSDWRPPGGSPCHA
jgi:hypothetical protein